MPLNRQHQYWVFVIGTRQQSALHQLEDVIGQRLLVIILERSVGGQRSVPAPRHFLGLRAAHYIRHVRSAVALASAHHCAQQFASHGGGIGSHAHFLHAHVTRAATVRITGTAFARNRLVTLPEMLHKPSMPTHCAARHPLHRFKLNAALRHRCIERLVGLGVRALIIQSRARLVGAALGDGIPLHHVSV